MTDDYVGREVPHNSNIVTTIIQELERETGIAMENLPVLANYTDIDALVDAIENDPTGTTTVSFEYDGYTIHVTSTTVQLTA